MVNGLDLGIAATSISCYTFQGNTENTRSHRVYPHRGRSYDSSLPCHASFLHWRLCVDSHTSRRVLIMHLRPKAVGADVPYCILREAQVGGLVTLQAVELLAQHLLGYLDPLSEGGWSDFVGVAEGQGELAVLAPDDGQG